MFSSSVIQLMDEMGKNSRLFARLQIKHKHVDVEVLTFEEAEETAFVGWFVLSNTNNFCC